MYDHRQIVANQTLADTPDRERSMPRRGLDATASALITNRGREVSNETENNASFSMISAGHWDFTAVENNPLSENGRGIQPLSGRSDGNQKCVQTSERGDYPVSDSAPDSILKI